MEALLRLLSGKDISGVCTDYSSVNHLAVESTTSLQTDKKGKVVEDMLVEEGSYRAQGMKKLGCLEEKS